MVAGGSGITPMLQVAEEILRNPADKTEVGRGKGSSESRAAAGGARVPGEHRRRSVTGLLWLGRGTPDASRASSSTRRGCPPPRVFVAGAPGLRQRERAGHHPEGPHRRPGRRPLELPREPAKRAPLPWEAHSARHSAGTLTDAHAQVPALPCPAPPRRRRRRLLLPRRTPPASLCPPRCITSWTRRPRRPGRGAWDTSRRPPSRRTCRRRPLTI